MRLMTIASGSSGNAGYLGSESTHLLIDAGISRGRIVQGLEVAGLKPGELSGVRPQAPWRSSKRRGC